MPDPETPPPQGALDLERAIQAAFRVALQDATDHGTPDPVAFLADALEAKGATVSRTEAGGLEVVLPEPLRMFTISLFFGTEED